MFRSGNFVKQFIEYESEERVQSTGVDLTVGKIYRVNDTPLITDGEYYKGEREEIEPDEDRIYTLNEGKYVVVYNEIIEIPEGHVGFVFPRSRLLRSKAHLTSAMWDPGYRGKGEGLLICDDIQIEDGCGVGKMGLIQTDSNETYEGSHQGEKL